MAGTKAAHERPTETVHIELDLGDTAFVVREFSDGMWALEVNGERLLLDTNQMGQVVEQIVRLGRKKFWIAEADGS